MILNGTGKLLGQLWSTRIERPQSIMDVRLYSSVLRNITAM